MQRLIDDIKQHIAITDDALDKILSRFYARSFSKKTIISSPGDTATHFQFITGGLIRVYYADPEGRDTTIQLGIEGMWINNLYSFLTQTPSLYYVQVLEPGSLLQLHKDDLEILFTEVPVMETFFRLKVQRAYIALNDRTLHQLHKSAEERYLEFRNRYGHIEPRVPQYMVASYLNITPEHLSKVRNKLARS